MRYATLLLTCAALSSSGCMWNVTIDCALSSGGVIQVEGDACGIWHFEAFNEAVNKCGLFGGEYIPGSEEEEAGEFCLGSTVAVPVLVPVPDPMFSE